MNYKLNVCLVLLFVSFIVINTTNAEGTKPGETIATGTTATTTTTTTIPTTTTQKPKIDVLKSVICTKCRCDAKFKLLDCTEKLHNTWLTDDEWKILQNGDILFETINLRHNNFTNIPILPPYPVKNFYLSFNQIVNITKEAFANLTELVKLDLSHNNITSNILVPDVFKGNTYAPKSFSPIKNLIELNLGYNDLHTLNSDLFEHLPNLNNLTLCDNTFQIIDSSTQIALAQLKELKYLDMSNIEISKIPDALFHAIRKLEVLLLAGNLFKEIPVAIQYAKNLKVLSLDENPIADLEDNNVFPEMLYLETLRISYMPELRRIESHAFGKLPKLNTLFASDNPKLSYIDRMAFVKKNDSTDVNEYVPIKQLYLRNNNLTTVNRQWFDNWSNITTIDFQYNPWECDCVNSFLIKELILQINKTTTLLTKYVECSLPENLKAMPILKVYVENISLPCEKVGNSVILACFLVVLLVILPLAIASFVFYRRGCFGLRDRFTRRDDRALYSRATFTDDFHI